MRDISTTLVYDLTGGQKKNELTRLVTLLKAAPGVGEPIHIISQGKVDFVIVLGKNAIK